jgi:hypothetical protein
MIRYPVSDMLLPPPTLYPILLSSNSACKLQNSKHISKFVNDCCFRCVTVLRTGFEPADTLAVGYPSPCHDI